MPDPDYKALYFNLFNNVTDTIERLKEAQQKAEQEYIEEESPATIPSIIEMNRNNKRQP